jgi:hypothetical protein
MRGGLRRTNRQQLLEESAKQARPIDEMDFQNPVARCALRVTLA